MITSDQETRSAADAQNLLLKDHQYFADSYWKNELSGETRVNWLIGATTATAAGLIALAAKEQPPPWLRTLTVMAFGLLLSFGILTTFRLLKRNESTDSYTEGLDNIRKLFRDHFDRDQVLAHYDPFRPRDVPTNINYRRFGGLAYFAAILNSILLTAIVLSLFYDSKNPLLPMAFSGVIFASALVVQYWCLRLHEKMLKQRRKQNDATHAGGIIFRLSEDKAAEYLLVRPLNISGEWVFPKGHIESKECARETALREVFEETGVFGHIIAFVGASEFTTNREKVTAKYYLMHETREAGSGELRERKWFPFREACDVLTHDGNKELLKRADRIRIASRQRIESIEKRPERT